MPKIVDHEKYREELVLKCFELFSKKGFSNVTIREITDELDISTGSFYHYFPTKQAIFEEMFKVFGKSDVSRIVERIYKEKTFEGKLKKFSNILEEQKEHYQNLLLLCIDFFRNNEPLMSEKVIKDFADYYSKAVCNNLEISERFGPMIMMWLIGLVYHSLLTPKSISISEQFSIFQELLVVCQNTNKKKLFNGENNG